MVAWWILSAFWQSFFLKSFIPYAILNPLQGWWRECRRFCWKRALAATMSVLKKCHITKIQETQFQSQIAQQANRQTGKQPFCLELLRLYSLFNSVFSRAWNCHELYINGLFSLCQYDFFLFRLVVLEMSGHFSSHFPRRMQLCVAQVGKRQSARLTEEGGKRG